MWVVHGTGTDGRNELMSPKRDSELNVLMGDQWNYHLAIWSPRSQPVLTVMAIRQRRLPYWQC